MRQQTPGGVTRDYRGLWDKHYAAALRSGMSTHMAKYVADGKTDDQRMADVGGKRVGSGDFEYMY